MRKATKKKEPKQKPQANKENAKTARNKKSRPSAPDVFQILTNVIKKDSSFHKTNFKIDGKMKRYQTSTGRSFTQEDSLTNKTTDKYMSIDDERSIQKVFDLDRSFLIKIGLNGYNEDFKVTIPTFDFINPFQSLKTIRKNKDVFSDISGMYLKRQKHCFSKSIKAYNSMLTKNTKTLPVRVLKTEPKVEFVIPLIDITDEKKKKVNLSSVIINNQLKLFAYYRYSNKDCPEGREQFTMTFNKLKVILFGGLSSIQRSNYIWSMDINTLEWTKIIPNNSSYLRFGHTTVCYQDRLYIFGGRTKIQYGSMTVGLEIFSFQDNSWINPILAPKSSPTLRRNHIAIIIGTQMFIHGGIDESEQYLNDCAILNFSPLKWLACHIDLMTPSPFLYGHSAALVVPSHYLTNPRMNIYKFPDNIGLTVMDMRIKDKGLYIFGGKTKEKEEATNDLWILKLGLRNLEWIKPVAKGKPPCPRFHHTMNYYEPGNYLIVHGGKNDVLSASSALSDTFIFNIEQLEWIEIELYSHIMDFKLLTRCAHSSLIYCKCF